jgi:predicted ABC-class ATPase
MIRDEKMIELVSPDQEPITPFVKKVQSLYKDKGVSAIIVVGGSGDYFDVADHVIMMNNYQCFDVTKRAKDIAEKWNKLTDSKSSTLPFGNIANRFPRGDVFVPDDKVSVRSSTAISYGRTDIDLSGLEQIVGKSQTQSIALILQMIPKLTKVETTLHQMLIHVERLMDERGLQVIDTDQFHGGLARPRKYEIAGAINRLRIPGSLIQK